MNPRPNPIHANAGRWLDSAEGMRHLSARGAEAAAAFQQPDLANRLAVEMAAAKDGGAARLKIGSSLRLLSEQLTLLALAHSRGVAIPGEAWRQVTTIYLPALYSVDELTFQGRNATPPWKSVIRRRGGNLARFPRFVRKTGRSGRANRSSPFPSRRGGDCRCGE